MNKNDLTPMKHILVTRNKGVYWYLDKSYFGNNNIKCLTSTGNINLEQWTDDLLFNRNEWCYQCFHRDFDVILIYEIIDAHSWLNILTKKLNDGFIDVKQFIAEQDYFGKNKPYLKLVYERIDGCFEDNRNYY